MKSLLFGMEFCVMDHIFPTEFCERTSFVILNFVKGTFLFNFERGTFLIKFCERTSNRSQFQARLTLDISNQL